MKTGRNSVARGESGQSLVEFAVTAPLLILIFVGILDLGRVVFLNAMLSAAAQEGARAGAVTADYTTITAAVQNRMTGINVDRLEIAIERTDAYTEVEVRYEFDIITPLITTVIGEEFIQLQQSARMQFLGVTIGS